MRTSVLCVVSILTMAAVACSSDPEQRTLPTEDDSDDERRDSGFTQPGRSSSSSGESPGSSSGETPGSSSGNQSSSGAASFMPPVCDGVVAAGEYGSMDHSVTTATLQTWSVTWDLENLYLAVENATLSEGALLYLDTSGGGSTAGAIYDNQAPNLPFGAELVIYAKQGYRNYRLASGATTWADPVENTGIEVCVGASDTREIVVPWSLVGGRPASFGFLGYLTSTGGSVYGTLPENPDQVIGELTTSFAGYYRVSDSTVVTPFADRQGD